MFMSSSSSPVECSHLLPLSSAASSHTGQQQHKWWNNIKPGWTAIGIVFLIGSLVYLTFLNSYLIFSLLAGDSRPQDTALYTQHNTSALTQDNNAVGYPVP